MSLTIREAYDLLYSHPRETCPHCQKPKHAQKCSPQIAYEKHATWELDEARGLSDREDRRRETDEISDSHDGSVDWSRT